MVAQLSLRTHPHAFNALRTFGLSSLRHLQRISIGNVGLRGFNTNINALALSFQRASIMAFAYLNHEHAHQRIAYQKAPLKDENFRISIANHLNTCILGFGLYFSQEPWNRAVIVYGETDFSWDKSINFPFVAPQSATLHNPPRASNGYFNLHVGLNVYCHAWSLTEYCRSAFEQLIGSRLVHR